MSKSSVLLPSVCLISILLTQDVSSPSLLTGYLLLKYQEVAVKKFLEQDFSGDALNEFKREVSIDFSF